MESECLKDRVYFVGGNKKVLELYNDDRCTALWMYSWPLNNMDLSTYLQIFKYTLHNLLLVESTDTEQLVQRGLL